MVERFESILSQFKDKNIIVLGDFYLDEYFHCKAENFSPEAPVPRAIIQSVEHIPGCAGNISLAFKNLGAKVYCCGNIGNDDKGVILRNKLLDQGIITTGLILDFSRVTGVFSRILLEGSGDNKQHIVRFDQENNKKISPPAFSKKLEFLKINLPKADLLFIADYDENYGKGVITKTFLDSAIRLAKENNVKIVGISRRNIINFQGLDLLVLNRKELSESLSQQIDSNDQLDGPAKDLLRKTNSKRVIITKGKEGLEIFSNHKEKITTPSYAKDVVDVCGAGDALSTTFALCSLTDANLKESSIIASHAAAVAISKIGTSPVYTPEVLDSIYLTQNLVNKIVLDHSVLSEKLNKLKENGKKIVFTNGYFDILHSGHIDFLKKSKELGDILVLAINSDRSTKENVGDGRPILNEQERLKVLSCMDFIDYVTIFDELTPLRVISSLKPNILAKGGNYNLNQIVGKDIVESNGGKVAIISLSHSTKTIDVIDRINKVNGDLNK